VHYLEIQHCDPKVRRTIYTETDPEWWSAHGFSRVAEDPVTTTPDDASAQHEDQLQER
jgi:N-acetylglutamate synthase-like GNAT family acetyltransferase